MVDGPARGAGEGGAARAPGRAVVRFLARFLGAADREVLWWYLLTRVAVATTAYCTPWLFPSDPGARDPGPFLAPFQHWDWNHYLNIARDGYFPGGNGPWTPGWDNREAFFPGFPLALRAVHTVLPDWTVAGLTVSFAAGAVAVVALARIARLHLPVADASRDASLDGSRRADVGRRAVLFLLLSPCAIFLALGYTEALFLALALPAWLAAHNRHWPLATALTALATCVRVSGLFLAAALALHFVLTARTRSQWRRAPWLALPALPAVLHSAYLHAHTGDWMAWKHAEERGWYRTFHPPWEAWRNTWHSAFGHHQTTGYAVMFQAELAAMVVGLVLLVFLIRRRSWPEALYIALTLWALGTSYWFMSVPRATLLWWPLWVHLAVRSTRTPKLGALYLTLSVPLTVLLAVAYLSGRWAG
ncbi:mannosyltransferase family protein [Streptomyces sp. NPDC059740]|uniref:mannosyltransferase family protein n=1 Tax=Streptomyces sp. NPDC059740 TaxID=3346926 RepID=UPI00364B35E4